LRFVIPTLSTFSGEIDGEQGEIRCHRYRSRDGRIDRSHPPAKKGFKTLLLEKEDQVGGYAVSFKRQGFLFDATGAFVGDVTRVGNFFKILNEIGAREEIEFIPSNHVQNIYPGFEVHLRPGGFHSYTEALFDLFPREEKGLKTYLSMVKRIGDEIKSYSEITTLKRILFPFYFRNLVRFHRSSHQTILDNLFTEKRSRWRSILFR